MANEEFKFKTDLIIPNNYYKECLSIDYNINDINQIITNINGSDSLKKLKGLIGLRKVMLKEEEKEEQKLLYNDANMLFDLLENYPQEFKYECLICLSCIENYNLKYEQKIKNEPNDKIIKIILHILEFSNEFNVDFLRVTLNYVNLLINNKDMIKKFETKKLYYSLKNLITNNKYSNQFDIIGTCLEILSQIFEIEEQISENVEIILELIMLLDDIIKKYESNNKDILNFSLKIFYSITNYNIEKKSPTTQKIMNKILEIKILQKLINKIDKLDIENDRKEILFSLRIIGNFAAMDDSFYTDKIIELNILDKLKLFIQDKYHFNIRKETAWIISNIAAGSSAQIIKLYENNYPEILIDIILNGNEDKIKDNCLWALYNFSNISNKDYLNNLVEKGFIDIIINRLKIDTGDTLCCSLEALNNILIKGKNNDPANFNIIESKVNELNILKELKNFINVNQLSEICFNKAKAILNNYFGIEDINQFLNTNEVEIS